MAYRAFELPERKPTESVFLVRVWTKHRGPNQPSRYVGSLTVAAEFSGLVRPMVLDKLAAGVELVDERGVRTWVQNASEYQLKRSEKIVESDEKPGVNGIHKGAKLKRPSADKLDPRFPPENDELWRVRPEVLAELYGDGRYEDITRAEALWLFERLGFIGRSASGTSR